MNEHPYEKEKDIGDGRVCSQCNEWKEWKEFNKNKFNVAFGMRSYCKSCGKEMYQRNVQLRKDRS